MSISVSNIAKRFGNFVALDNVSLEFSSGELTALLGPSGCGKTTLLRIIAGLEVQDSGSVVLAGDDASQQSVRERHVGFVFQHYALFRHMTVFENVAFGLRVKPRAQRPNNATIERKVHQLLELVQLDWLADRYPSQLSGGQRQRIALARALAVEPKVLLLDEPFGALDAKVRKELRRWLRRLHDDLHVTSIFVTHDQEEALEVADRIVVMNHGKVEQIGTPQDVYDHPQTPFVYSFLGSVNLFHGRVQGDALHVGDHALELDRHTLSHGAPAIGYVRPHEIEVFRLSEGLNDNTNGGLPAKVQRILALGPSTRLELVLEVGGQLVEADISRERLRELNLKEGEAVLVRPVSVRVFPAEQRGESELAG